MNHYQYLLFLQQVDLYLLIFLVNSSSLLDNDCNSFIDIITREPPWGVSESCLECGMKFTITNRRHHWCVVFSFECNDFAFCGFDFSRHCGRVLCKRCSVTELPIMKFNLQKPVRVCQLCNDVLTLGAAAAR
jgi:hypothetical protein